MQTRLQVKKTAWKEMRPSAHWAAATPGGEKTQFLK